MTNLEGVGRATSALDQLVLRFRLLGRGHLCENRDENADLLWRREGGSNVRTRGHNRILQQLAVPRSCVGYRLSQMAVQRQERMHCLFWGGEAGERNGEQIRRRIASMHMSVKEGQRVGV